MRWRDLKPRQKLTVLLVLLVFAAVAVVLGFLFGGPSTLH
jgi:hypothetical protein